MPAQRLRLRSRAPPQTERRQRREQGATECLDDLDVPTALDWLERASGRVTIRDVDAPPPFLFRLVAAGTTDSMLLEERDAFLRRLWERAVESSTATERSMEPG